MRDGRLCVRHTGEIEAARGQGCGEAGWGPGHRTPAGWTVALMDESVAMARAACEAGTGCGATVDPGKLRCMSRDKCETAYVLWGSHPWYAAGTPIKIMGGTLDECKAGLAERSIDEAWNLDIRRDVATVS